ncbi:unnamed protein product [Rhizophagus irregularis]|nr:unnamed protein product [Rhizophagus irregularis]
MRKINIFKALLDSSTFVFRPGIFGRMIGGKSPPPSSTFDDFNNKVRPYKNIIPNQIYEEIEEFYNKGTTPKIILPPRFNSKIIKPKLAKIILKWINKEDWISRYKFIPIYRGSIDGISNKSFKNKCKGQVGSLVLIKVNYSNKIFGGYSSIGFNSIEDSLLRIYNDNHRFYHSSNNFIFSFENDEDTQNMKISRVINYDKAIYDQPHNGFNFGYNAFFMTENHCIINNYSCNYENNIRTETIYSIEEIETFIIYNDDNYDTIIQVGENENIKEFRAHSVILRSRSPYFVGAFSSSWVKKENDIIIFNKPNVTPNIFDMILRYIYSGKLDLTEKLSDILKLLVASDELLLEELCDYLREYLTKERYNWIHKDFVLVFYTVRKLANCEFLQNYCFETICFDPEFIITSFSFPSLERDMYYDLLEREDLLIKEIVAWDYLIIWDYEALKETLNEFIPLIRFTNITFDDFKNKVRPYKNIIPNHIYEEIEEFYNKGTIPKIILPPRKIENFNSKIIKSRLIRRIIEWINIEDFWISNYNLNLIYRGSIDGISNKSFKNKCKGQVKSLVLVKVNYSKKIIGGYSSIGFNSIEDSNLLLIYEDNRRFYHSSNNFIFSLENNEDIQNMKISRVINYDKAIYDQPHNGFNFGYNAFFMSDNYCIANNYSYNYEDNLKTVTVNSIEEIETFIITE